MSTDLWGGGVHSYNVPEQSHRDRRMLGFVLRWHHCVLGGCNRGLQGLQFTLPLPLFAQINNFVLIKDEKHVREVADHYHMMIECPLALSEECYSVFQLVQCPGSEICLTDSQLSSAVSTGIIVWWKSLEIICHCLPKTKQHTSWWKLWRIYQLNSLTFFLRSQLRLTQSY